VLIPRGVTPLEGLVTYAAGPAEPRLIQFKSTDGRASWTAVSSGLTNTYVVAFAINPATPSTLYAGTFGGGVFENTDGGASCTAVNTGL